MKGLVFLRKIIFSSWFLAGIPAIILILFLPPIGSKFTLLVEPAEKQSGQFVYADLNSDSISEVVSSGKGIPYLFIAVRDKDHRFFEQWNLTDSLDPYISELFFGDYDHDRYKEIYIFTYKGDSLFLNVNEVLDPSGTKLERIFITKVGYIRGIITSIFKPAGFFDVNGDGKDEMYFGITTGFGLEPRRLYYFDLLSKQLTSSQFTGTICLIPEMTDSDDDLKPEIFGQMSASGNYKTKTPFSDNSTWFMVFDEHLNFEFPPIEFQGFANGLDIADYENGTDRGYIVNHWAGGADTSVLKSRIIYYSADGKPITYRLYSDIGNSRYKKLFVTRYHQKDRIYLLDDRFLELDDKLNVVRTIDLPFYPGYYSFQRDINFDGEDEILLYSDEHEKLLVYDGGLNLLADAKLKMPENDWNFSDYLAPDHQQKIFLKSGDTCYFLNLKNNKYYYLSYLQHLSIYFLIFFFILIVRRITTYQVIQRESYKNRLIELQLQSIKSQLDPHFTFNALNSIASLIYLEDRQLAYDYLNKFTTLLRTMLKDSERTYRSLSEELEFVKTYLDIEKLRFGEKFNYLIVIGDGVSQKEQVPKMVLQTFAENAIKHGLMPCNEGGILKISLEKENDSLKLSIEDNGIGRAKSAGRSTSTGKGLTLTGEFHNILNQINKKPIRSILTDLYNETGDAAGTRVEVWVPVE